MRINSAIYVTKQRVLYKDVFLHLSSPATVTHMARTYEQRKNH